MNIPHAHWAKYYDKVYDYSYNELYNSLTQTTINVIKNTIVAPAKIVDFGAGTGRLAVPLSSAGYDIVAVEPCKEMIDQLIAKAQRKGLKIVTECQRMQDFQADGQYDMALCVFTVLPYILDYDSLTKSVHAVERALRPGGLLLIDVPSRQLFQSYEIINEQISRHMFFEAKSNNIYQYQETTEMPNDGQPVRYTDSFKIRYWEPRIIQKLFASEGFYLVQNLSQKFASFGSRYFIMGKGIT